MAWVPRSHMYSMYVIILQALTVVSLPETCIYLCMCKGKLVDALGLPKELISCKMVIFCS